MSHDNGDTVGKDFSQYTSSDYDTTTDDEDEDSLDIHLLNQLCNDVTKGDDEGWDIVRHWLITHSPEEIRSAAGQRGENGMTALHLCCRNQPPLDIIECLIGADENAVESKDIFGWLPIHYAAACMAHHDVIAKLTEDFPSTKTSVDHKGRAAVHFVLSNGNLGTKHEVETVAMLISTGAATYVDDNGMLVSAQRQHQETLFMVAP
jgi:ankyrin repeat protein